MPKADRSRTELDSAHRRSHQHERDARRRGRDAAVQDGIVRPPEIVALIAAIDRIRLERDTVLVRAFRRVARRRIGALAHGGAEDDRRPAGHAEDGAGPEPRPMTRAGWTWRALVTGRRRCGRLRGFLNGLLRQRRKRPELERENKANRFSHAVAPLMPAGWKKNATDIHPNARVRNPGKVC